MHGGGSNGASDNGLRLPDELGQQESTISPDRPKGQVVEHNAGTTVDLKVDSDSASVLTAEGVEKSFRRGVWPFSHRQPVLQCNIQIPRLPAVPSMPHP